MSVNLSTKISYRLHNGQKIKDKTKPTFIYMRIRRGDEIDYKPSLKIKILFDDWDSKKQRVKNRIHIRNKDIVNSLLDKLTSFVTSEIIKYKSDGKELSNETAKIIFESYFKKEDKPKTKETLFSFIDKFIEVAKTHTNVHTGKRVSKQTINSYNVTKNILTRFNDEVYKIDFNSVTLDFYFDFVEWCENQLLSKNYIGKHIKTLKTFLNEALEQELHTNIQFKSKKFKVLKEEADNIYLSNDELLMLWNKDLSHNNQQERARDLFLIGAFTGLRVSDYNNLSTQHIKKINDVDMLHVKTKKTGKVVAIPLHPIVKEILKRYDWNAPPRMADQQINNLIKEVGEDVGIDNTEYKTQTKGGKQITSKKCKFQMIQTHTARRSFCTNAYLSGMNAIDIMAISGHKTERAFLTYIKVTPEQTALRMAKHTFFNPIIMKVI